MKIDYLVVGSGLTGSVIARLLSDAGKSVQVVERRNHLGGNVYDYLHPSGVRVHRYGPHCFRTHSKRIWDFVNTFSRFYKFELRIKTQVADKLEHWPVQSSYIDKYFGGEWTPPFTRRPSNFEERCLSMMPEKIYKQFVKGYTEKQWGVAAHSLDARLAGRFNVRMDGDTRLMQARYQGLPENGYHQFMQNLLDGIPVEINFDYLNHRSTYNPQIATIYTGPIDQFFDYQLGKLQYRSQKRKHQFFPGNDLQLAVPIINNPSIDNGAHIRTIEWKQLMPYESAKNINGTLLTVETPFSPTQPDQYEYPFPDQKNALLAKAYIKKAQGTKNLVICGRLGEYRYYDMDQAISRAMIIGKKLIKESQS